MWPRRAPSEIPAESDRSAADIAADRAVRDDEVAERLEHELAALVHGTGLRRDDAPEYPGPMRTRMDTALKWFTRTLVVCGLVLVLSLAYLIAETGGWIERPPPSTGEGPAAAPAVATAPAASPMSAVAQETAPAATAPTPGPALAAPDVPTLVILIRSVLLALDQANVTGDYAVLRAIGSPAFRNNSAERIGQAFGDLRTRRIDLSSIAVVNPVLDEPPILEVVDGRPMMRLKGTYPGAAGTIAFDLVFEMAEGRWRLFGLGVNPTGKGAPLPAFASAPAAEGPPVLPSPQAMLALIRGAVLALGQANATGNYAVLDKMSAPGFREANGPARLAEIFAALRDRGLDLGPVLVIDPGLYRAPAIMENGMMRLTGYFPSEPERVNFDLAFQNVEGRWRLFGLGVNTSREVADVAAVDPAPAGPEEGGETVADEVRALPPTPRPRPE